jgi:hypothetical protein
MFDKVLNKVLEMSFETNSHLQNSGNPIPESSQIDTLNPKH